MSNWQIQPEILATVETGHISFKWQDSGPAGSKIRYMYIPKIYFNFTVTYTVQNYKIFASASGRISNDRCCVIHIITSVLGQMLIYITA